MDKETELPETKGYGFKTTSNKGFQITFKNHWTISVQWGTGNYCYHGYNGKYGSEMTKDSHHSPDCEISIWYNDGETKKDYDFGYDSVKGYCDPEEVSEWIYKVSHFS